MTYEEKMKYLKNRTTSDDIFVIADCIECDKAFFKLSIDVHRSMCYGC